MPSNPPVQNGGSSSNNNHAINANTANMTEECKERWVCRSWAPNICPENEIQTRVCEETNNCGTELLKPIMSKTCSYIPQPEEERKISNANIPKENEPTLETPKAIVDAKTESNTKNLIYILMFLFIASSIGVLIYHQESILQKNRMKSHLFDIAENYIRNTLAMGYDKQRIRNALLDKGWHEEIIDPILNKL